MDVLYSCCDGVVYVDKNIIKIKPYNPHRNYGYEMLEDIYHECGYVRFEPAVSGHIVYDFIGKTLDEFKEELKRRAKILAKHRGNSMKYFKRWIEQCETFSDIPIGIDKQIDDFETGFSVFVLMNSKYTRKKQADFIRNNKKKFIAFVVQEIKRLKKRKYANLIPFCRVSNVMVTNRNEAVVTFELKEKLEDVLKNV